MSPLDLANLSTLEPRDSFWVRGPMLHALLSDGSQLTYESIDEAKWSAYAAYESFGLEEIAGMTLVTITGDRVCKRRYANSSVQSLDLSSTIPLTKDRERAIRNGHGFVSHPFGVIPLPICALREYLAGFVDFDPEPDDRQTGALIVCLNGRLVHGSVTVSPDTKTTRMKIAFAPYSFDKMDFHGAMPELREWEARLRMDEDGRLHEYRRDTLSKSFVRRIRNFIVHTHQDA